MAIELTELEIKRKHAILCLTKAIETWDKYDYVSNDWKLDKTLREVLDLPEKSMGKPPYEWI